MTKRYLGRLLAAGLLALSSYSTALCADVKCVVKGPDGQPVFGAKVIAVDESQRVAGSDVSAVNGKYKITGLNPGKYTLKLDPMKTSFKPGETVADVTEKGLQLVWDVSPTDAAIGRRAKAFECDSLGLYAVGGAVAGAGGIGSGIACAVGAICGGGPSSGSQ